MSYAQSQSYERGYTLAVDAPVDARAEFISKTYFHLAGAVLAFAGLATIFIQTAAIRNAIGQVLTLPYGTLLLVAGFLVAGWVASYWAHNATSVPLQYLGLGLYIVIEAVIFTPLLMMASRFPGVIESAGILTATIFTGLTLFVFATRKNFSFLGPVLCVLGFAALGVVICSIVLGFTLGIVFTAFMIALACGYILYDTSRVLHEYHIGQHVGASLELFASVALLFWYVVRLLMSLQRD